MPLKAKVTSLDAVDEKFRGEYTKGDDGAFYLNVDGVDDMPALAGLRRKNAELLDEKKKIEAELKLFGDYTPASIAELKKKAEAGGSKDVKELEEKLRQTSENAQKEILKAQEESRTSAAAAETYFRESEITRVLGLDNVRGNPALIAHVMEKSVKVEKGADGKFRAVVVDGQGNARIKNSQGESFGLVDLALELKEKQEYGGAFASSGNSGSGAPNLGGGGGGGGQTTVKAENGILRVNPDDVVSGKTNVVTA